jgi:hypothetical protein
MSKRYTDLDALIKDLLGEKSKFYKDWMKGKAKREAASERWVKRLLKQQNIEESLPRKKKTTLKKNRA